MKRTATILAFGAVALLGGVAYADDCSKKPIDCCVDKGGDILTCACLNGGPCEGALVTISCAEHCEHLHKFDDSGKKGAPASLEFYDANGNLLYTDHKVYGIHQHDDNGGFTVMATGNLNNAEFDAMYRAAGGLFDTTRTGVTIKLYENEEDPNKAPEFIVGGPFVPTGQALWAQHSGDGQNALAQLKAHEDADAQDEIDDEAELQAERVARALADAQEKARAMGAEATLNTKINNEIDRATNAEQTLQNNIDAEAQARMQGDIDTLNNAKAYTDLKVAAEAAARIAADADLQAQIDAEKAARIAADAAEAAARAAGDAAEAAARAAADAAEAAARDAADVNLQNQITVNLHRLDGHQCPANQVMDGFDANGDIHCIAFAAGKFTTFEQDGVGNCNIQCSAQGGFGTVCNCNAVSYYGVTCYNVCNWWGCYVRCVNRLNPGVCSCTSIATTSCAANQCVAPQAHSTCPNVGGAQGISQLTWCMHSAQWNLAPEFNGGWDGNNGCTGSQEIGNGPAATCFASEPYPCSCSCFGQRCYQVCNWWGCYQRCVNGAGQCQCSCQPFDPNVHCSSPVTIGTAVTSMAMCGKNG